MKLRVTHVLESFNYTGAGRQVVALARELPRDEFELFVAALGCWGPLADELIGAGVNSVALGRRCRWDPFTFLRLRRWLSQMQPDIVHSWQFAANATGRMAAPDGCKLVVSERRIDLWKGWFEEAVDAWLLPRTDRVIVACQAVYDAYLLRTGFSPSQQLVIIPPGVAPPAGGGSRHLLLEQLGLPENAILIAAVGSLTHDQRVGDMLWAVEILGALFPQLHLLVVGDGPQRGVLERLAGYLRRTALMHFLGHCDAIRILPHVDMLWHAGAEDRLPSAVLEAMAAGIPIVACDTPALRELITPGETGLLFPLGDRPGLARSTQKLLQDRALARHLGAHAQQHVTEQYSTQAIVDRHAELYRELAAGRRRPRRLDRLSDGAPRRDLQLSQQLG